MAVTGRGKACGQARAPGASVRSHVDATSSCCMCGDPPDSWRAGPTGGTTPPSPSVLGQWGAPGPGGWSSVPWSHGSRPGAWGRPLEGAGAWGAFQGGEVEAGPAGVLKACPSWLPHCSRPEVLVPQQPRVMVLGRQDVGPSPRVLQALGALPHTLHVPKRVPRAGEELCGLSGPRGLCSPDSPLDAQLNPHGGCLTLS